MASYTRGSTVTITAVFKDEDGQPTDPLGAHVHLAFRAGGQLTHASYVMVAGAAHVWSYAWDSSVADPGEVSGHCRTDGAAPISSADFKFSLVANAGNPVS
jgi:hypothetical protein